MTVLLPGLTMTKTANRSTVTPGESIDYTISVVNNGETSYPAATFNDDLSRVLTDATYTGGATATVGTVSFSTPTLSWTGPLAPGETASISYSVTVRDPDPGDKHLTNSVVSTSRGSNCAAGSTDARCAAVVDVLVPGLTITKTADAVTTRPGASVGYSITVTNSGATPATAAAFSDSLTGVVDDAGYNADVSATAGTAVVSGSTLSWSGNLAVGATATVTYSVTVNAADVGNDLLTGTVTSSTRGSNCFAGNVDTRCTTTVPVARLVLAYPDTNLTTTPGSTVNFTATYANTGQVPYTDINVAVQSPDAADDVGSAGTQTASSGTFVLNETGTTWTGSIPVAGVVTVTATLTILDPDTGDGTFTATMLSSAPGSNCPAGGADPRCRVTTTVLTPGLTVTKVADTTATVPGGTVGYTITVRNTGQTPYVGAEASDTLTGVLDDATYNADASATGGAVSYASPTLTWTGDLAVGATATITYSVTVRSPDPGDKTMVNRVSSANVGSTCLPASGIAACHTTVAVLTPALTIVKTADRATTTLDTDVVYTVEVTNSGQTPYASAAFSDSLAGVLDDATYVPAETTATSGAVTYDGGVLGWSGTLPTGASATVTYTVTVNSPATGDRRMTNTVMSANVGSNCVSGSGDSRCTAEVAITNAVAMTFTRTADVMATKAGAVVGYTVTAVNSSDQAVEADFTDPMGGILDDATLTTGAVASAGTVVFTDPDLTWSGTVPAGGTVTVTYSVTVHTVVTGDQVLEGTLTSASPDASNNCLEGSLDPRCASTVPVAALLIRQSYTETSATPGSLLHLTATFTNTGKMPYTGITIASPSADVVDDAVPTGDQTASSGDLVLSASAITWTGSIPVGGTVTVQGTLTVDNPDTGDRRLTGTLVSQALGNNCPTAGTDVRCTAAINVLLPGLTISKVADTTYVVPGGTVGYTVTVHNTGQTAYAGAVVTDSLAGVVDDATYNADATADTGGLGYAGSTLTWTGDLAAGATATIGYTVTAPSAGTGDKTMVNVVTSSEVGSTCPVAGGNAACRSTIGVLSPALTITSSTSAAQSVPGGTVAYTVRATNTGQTPYTAAGLSVDLAGVLDDATLDAGVAATTGTVQVTAQTLTWTGLLNPGDAATVTYAVTVKSPPTGDFTLRQTVVSATSGSTCASVSTDARCSTVVLIASLLIQTSTDVTATKPTGVVRNTTTVTNTGTVAYLGAVVADDFSGTLDDATYNGDATATSGSLSFDVDLGRISWTGDLAPGEAATVTGSVTASNPATGDGVLTTVVSTDALASSCPTGSPGPGCTTNVALLAPGLTITKVADRTTASPGDAVTYTITATNTGETAYTGAVVTDDLSGVLNDAAYDSDATATSGAVAYTAPNLSWTGDLAVDETVEITFTVTVDDPYLGDGTMVNAATSEELGSTCTSTGVPGACSSAVGILQPALDLAVVADRSTTVPGASVGYTVTVRNTGETDYEGATVTLQLSGALDDSTWADDATATSGSVGYTASVLTWTGDLGVGETAVISYSLTVDDPGTGNLSLLTTVSSTESGATCGSGAQCSSTVTVLVPGLAVSTTADVATATPGDRVGFTITVSNTGQTAYEGTVVSTDLTGIVDDAVLGGALNASSGVVTYTAPTLTWTGTLEVGESASVTYSATVRAPDSGDKVMATTVVATGRGSTCPSGTANSACTTTVQVLIPSLSINKTAGSPTTTPGSVVDYTIVVVNTGETAYSAAEVDDSLSGVLTDVDYNGDASVVGGGTLDYTEPVLSWSGALAIGGTATISYSVTVHDPDPGDKHLVNTATSSAPGSTCPPGAAAARCTTEVDVLVPALTITKTTDTTSVVAGNTVTYTVTVTNSGETAYAPATFSDSLAGVLDDATYAGGATASTGSVDYATGTLTWTGPLAVGATATITYSLRTELPGTGNHTLTNAVTSDSPGSDCLTGMESACTTTVAVLVPGLSITKTTDASEVVAGGDLGYTISATNTGQADYSAATLSDSLADVLDDADYNADAIANTGSVSYADGALTWVGALPMGATATISYSVGAHVEVTGDEDLTNRVVSGTPGSTCPADSPDPGCVTSTPFAARTVEVSRLTSSFTLSGAPHNIVDSGGAVTMTVTTNSPDGYVVSVLPAAASMTSSDNGNGDRIPVARMSVRESGTTAFTTLSASLATVVHRQSTASTPGGDAISNDYRLEIPNVLPDTYSTTLSYVVTTQ